jgi:phosphatidylglycerol:prolipoprotein diacylglycerol transferase
MFNNWLTLGPITIHGYGVMIAIGLLAAAAMAEKLTKKYKLDYEHIDLFIVFVVVLGYVGSKLTYCLTVWDQFIANPLSVLGSGGWVVMGGLIGGVIAAVIWCRWKKWDFWKYFPVLMPCVALAQGFGRIGCFCAGCCGGIETSAWFGVSFPADSLAWTTAKIIPTQLLSSAFDFALFFFLMHNLNKGKHPEDTGAWYVMLYSLGRFMIEFIRGDLIRGQIWIFSTSQFISIFTFLLGAYLIWRRQRDDDKKLKDIKEA